MRKESAAMNLFSTRLSLSLCALSMLAPFSAGAQTTYKVGAKVKNFTLKDENARPVRLADYRGQVCLLVFYASWCGPCNEEAPALEKEVWQAYKGRGVAVMGVAVQEGVPHPAVKLKSFRAKHKLTYPLLSDEDMKLFNTYGGGGIPACILLDRQGRFVARYDELADVEKRLPTLVAAKLPAGKSAFGKTSARRMGQASHTTSKS